MKKQIKKERYEKLSAACEPFRRAKAETIHTLAGIGRKHRLLRYSIWIMLVAYIFIYNVILYGCIQLKIREKFARGVAFVMTLVLVFTSVDFTVFAVTRNGDSGEESQSVITAFAELDDSVAAQSLSIGAEESEISFPAALTVTLETEPEADTEQEDGTAVPEEGSEEPEKGTTEPEEGTEEPEKGTTEPEEGTTEPEEGTEEPEKGTTEPEEGTTEPEKGTGPEENKEPEESATPETSTLPEESTIPEENTEAEGGESGDMPTDVPMDSTEPVVPESSDDSPDDTNIVSAVIDFLLPEPMVVYAAEPNENTSAKSEALIDVTWKLDAAASTSEAFDSSEAGNSYVYVPVIPEEYTVAEGVSLPQITITIQEMEETAVEQTSAFQICGWHFGEENVFPEGELFCDDGGYSLVLAGGDSEVQIPFEEIISHLPTNVILEYSSPEAGTEETVSIAGWSCPEYTADEEGNLPYSGSFFFKALLAENGEGEAYKDWEGAGQIGVLLIFDSPMMTAAVTATPGTIASDEEWGDQILSAGTYTIKEGVTVTVSGTITVNGDVTINGGGKLLRGSSWGYFNVNGGTLTLEGIEVDGNGNSYQSSNAMITATNGTLTLDGCRIHDCVKTEDMGEGAAVNLYGSSADFRDAVIEDCQAKNYGGAVYMDGGSSLEIHGGTYQRNRTTLSTSSSYGGGFLYNSSSTVKIYGGSFICNTSTGRGGCIYNTGKEGTETYLYGGCFQGNQSTRSGYEGSGAVFYSSDNKAATIIELSGSVKFCGDGNEGSGTDGVYLDFATNASRKALISSELQYPLALYLKAEEGRVIAEGVEGYQLQIKDMKQISVNDVGTSGSAWYVKLDEDHNQIVLTTTNPEYDKNFYVAYVANGAEGTVRDSKAYKNGETVTVQSGAGLTYEGYTFAGWNTKPDGTGTAYQAGSTFPITEDVTLYARWEEAAKYKIIYSGLDGAALSTKPAQHTYGIATTVGNPTKTGYTFAGWKINDEAVAVKDLTLSATGYTADITLMATWTADSYTVTYAYQGATGGNSSTSKTVTYDGTYGGLPAPKKTGHTFEGWYTSSSGGTEVTSTTKVTTAMNHTLYAHWTANSYTATLNGNGGSGVTNTITYTYGNETALPTDWTKTGYSFDGWYDNEKFTGAVITKILITDIGDKEYWAKWKDDIAPVIGRLSYSYQPKNFWHWLIGKNRLIIDVPVTEEGSGADEITYTVTPEDGSPETKTAKIESGSAEIILSADFKGTVTITCTDKAGNKSGGVMAGTDIAADAAGFLIEDHPPVVKLALPDTPTSNSYGWYNEKIAITVTVTDDKDSGAAIISGGIAEIIWKDGENGTEQTVEGLPGRDVPVYTKEFTIPVNTDGTHTYYVNAVDNAGNESGWQTCTVKVDTGKPVFNGNITVTNPTKEGADISFTPSEGGKVYYVVSDTGTAPTAQEVKEQSGEKGGVQDITGGSSNTFAITGLTPGEKHTVYVVLEDAAGNLSEVKEGSFFTQPEAPAITLGQLTVDYTNETIKLPDNSGDVEAYTDPQHPESSKITPNADGSLPVTPGTAVYIRYPAKTEGNLTTPASDSVKIDILGRPAAPAAKQVTVTDTTAAVTNPAAGEEYVLVPEGQMPDWSNANTTGQFTELDPNKEYDLYVRKKATGNSFASDPVRTEIRTAVTIRTPVIEGDGAGKDGNTALRPDKSNADGTATFTGTYGEEYTPVIKAGGQTYTPEMTWDENAGKGSWEYTYPIPANAAEAAITVEFKKRTLTGVTAEPGSLTIYADDAANVSMEALNDYVKANSSARAVYDNKTRGAVQAAYAATGSFTQKGAVYTYTVSAEGKTDNITLTVSPVSASATTPDKYMQVQKNGGYTPSEVAAWLPAEVTVTYTGAGYTSRTESRAVTWNTASIGSDFGAALGENTITGTVNLPAWATGGNSVSIVIEFVDKIVLRDDQIQLTIPGFSYGEQTLPRPQGSVTVTDTSPAYTYLYSTDGGTTWVTADQLPKSDSGYLIPGEYRVKMTYRGDGYTGEKTAFFTVEKNALTILQGTLAVQNKNYDGTKNASLKEGGQPVLSGVAAGDDVTLGGSLNAVFTGAGPKKDIPVAVTGFTLEGKDAGYYVLKNTTLTLYATINNADGTPPASGGGNGGSSGGGNGGRKDDDDDSDTPGGNNASGTPAITTPVTPPIDTPVPGTDTNSDINGAAQQTQGTAKEGAKTGDTDNPNGVAEGDTNPLKPDAEPANMDRTGQDDADSGQIKEEASQTLQASIDGGKLSIAGDFVTTGNITEASETTTILEAGDGAVIVTVVCEEEGYTAGVKDTVAVTNAVLTPEQIRSVNDGETIEIRVDVKDISGAVPGRDREIIESGLTEYQKELPDLTLGMYIDISMFIKIGASDWDAVTETTEPIDVVVGVPEELKGDGRKFYIIRSHGGAYTLLPDTDDEPDTITVSTNLFSAYAIAYEEADGAGAGKCGLCHMCPTFLGICWFVWLAVIVMAVVAGWIVIRRKKKEKVK